MTQSASSPYPIRPIEEDELDGFLNVDEHAFNTSPWSDDDRRVGLDRFEFDRTLAAFDDTTPVGVTMCYSFRLSVPGQEVLPAAGVTFVAVLPTHRRRGVLRSLMLRQLADVRDRGEPLAILWASEAVIYGRYGYGRASWHLDFTLHRGEGRLAGTAASAEDGLRLRIAEPEAALPELAKVYDAVLATRPGMFGRNDAWWRSAIYDPAEQRQGAGPLRCLLAEDASGTRGYALYAGVDTWARLPAGERADGTRADGGRPRRQRRALRRPAQPGPDHRVPPAAASGRRPAALPAGRPAAGQAEAERQPVGADRRPAPRAGRPQVRLPGGRGPRGAGRDPAGQRRTVAADHHRRGARGRAGRLVRPGRPRRPTWRWT